MQHLHAIGVWKQHSTWHCCSRELTQVRLLLCPTTCISPQLLHGIYLLNMQQVKQLRAAATVLLLCTMCCCLTQSAAAQRRQLSQASWLSQSLSVQLTIKGPCDATGYPTDIGVTFADCARKDVERLPNVVVARTIRIGVQGAAAGSSCLTQKVSS
jgi:hypothetical protein